MKRDVAVYAGLACGCLATLTMARLVEPNPAGYGTHRQLGLPPCLFRTITGLPCPSCGLTTCFAHAARWDWDRALAAQPFGVLLFVGFGIAIPLLGWLSWRGVPIEKTADWVTRTPVLGTFLLCYLAGWSWKLYFG